MFSRNKPHSSPGSEPKKTGKPAVPSVISADLTITGNLVSNGEIQVDGTVIGDIRTDTLLVVENARVTGETVARCTRIHGQVEGQITARSVTLAKTAHVTGDIIHENLSIEKGAFLEGHCRRIEEEAGARREPVRDGAASPVPHAPASGGTQPASLRKPANGSAGDRKPSGNAEPRTNA